MPPRFAYWTILIDQKPTAFRARERDDLLPTLQQLKHTNTDVVLKWFARGRLWDTPEQERWATKNMPAAKETRDRGWRPGGTHRDPRERFKKHTETKRDRPSRPEGEKPLDVPQALGPAHKPRGHPSWRSKPPGRAPRAGKPWSSKPREPEPRAPQGEQPGVKQRAGGPRGFGPANKPGSTAGGPREARPRHDKSRHGQSGGGRQLFGPHGEPRRNQEPPTPAMPLERREAEPPPKRYPETTPAPPAPAEQVRIKPEPPERG